jgi:phage FluMu protein Com
MSVQKKVVDTMMVELFCDRCNQRMNMTESKTDIKMYKCPNCSAVQHSSIKYPYFEYKNRF